MDACAEDGDDEVDDCAVLVAVAAAMPPDDDASFAAAGFETSSEVADGCSSELSDVSGGGMFVSLLSLVGKNE